MFFKRKKEKKSIELLHLPLPVLIRQTIYDTMLEPAEDIADLLGLPPISDDVAEMEEDASQMRLENIASLLPFIDSHADLTARISVAAYSLDDEDDSGPLGIPQDEMEKITALFKVIALSSAVSCVATLVNLGLLEKKVDKHGK